MMVPMWMLLGFATWTVLLLSATVGVYRWTRILSGRATVSSFPSDQVAGEDWYRRSMRAHANCIENLPVFGAIVLTLYVTGLRGPVIDCLAIVVLVFRVLQSLVHVSRVQTDGVVALRFSFLCAQLVSFAILIALVVRHAMLT